MTNLNNLPTLHNNSNNDNNIGDMICNNNKKNHANKEEIIWNLNELQPLDSATRVRQATGQRLPVSWVKLHTNYLNLL